MKHTDNCFVELQALAEVIWTKKRRERKSDFFFCGGDGRDQNIVQERETELIVA